MVDMVKVLDLVNSARAAQGLASISVLPKGVIEDGRNCPLTRGLNGAVHRIDVDVIELGDVTEKVLEKWIVAWGLADEMEHFLQEEGLDSLGEVSILATPPILGQFIDEFDLGNFPELIEEKKND